MKKLLLLFVGATTLFLNVNAQIQEDSQSRIDSLFLQWDNDNSPGAAIGIVQGNKLIYTKGYGMANLDYKIPLSADSKFYVASITKQFTAACIALLSIEGKIGLDDNIKEYIPEIPDYGEEITIRNLIHHTSGLRDYLQLMYLSGKSFEDYFTISDGIKFLTKQRSLNFSPGEEHLYSNSGYILMAEIVNRVSGMTIRKYADKNIFQPLGMTNTFFNDNHSQITQNRVISYRKQGEDTLKRFVQNFDALGDGNLLTTVNDIFLWDQNFYRKKVGGKEFIDLMLTQGILNNGDTLQYAFGLEHGNYKGLKTIAHGGGFLGFRTQFMRFPEHNFSVIVFSNVADFNPLGQVYRIADILLDDIFIIDQTVEVMKEQLPDAMILTAEQLDKYCSFYWNDTQGYSRKIYISNDTLRYYRNENSENSLLPIDNDEFKMLDVDVDLKVKFEFSNNKVNKMIVTIDDGDPIKSFAYEKVTFTNDDRVSYVGSYYSGELDCIYKLKMKDDSLILYIKEKEITGLNLIMDNLLTNDNIGTLRFNKSDHSEFILSSGRVRGIKFTKQ